MQTLRQLMNSTINPVRSRAASQCSGIITVKDQSFGDKLRGRKGTKYRELRWSVTCTTGVRACVMRFYDGGRVEQKSQVWVTCDCPDFCFRWEVAVASTGSSAILHSDGSAPKIRNPQMRAGLCKHLYKIATDGVKALKETGVPESFFYEEIGKGKSRENVKKDEERYLPPEDERNIPWAGTPGYKPPPAAANIDWSKPTLVGIPPSLRDRLGGGGKR